MFEPTWQILLSNPAYRNSMKTWVRNILDTLEEILPLPDISDRYVAMSRWLNAALLAGVITANEESALRTEIAQEM